MRDLKTFREKIEAYRKNAPTPHTQKELAEAIPLDKDELSKRLNAYRRPERTSSPLSCAQVQAIVRILARWGAIETQEQAKDLLDLMECPYFSSSDWKTHPLNLLRSTPISTIRLPSIPANTDKQRKELGLLEERNPSHLRILTLEEMVALSRKYLAVLTERNKMLDFKGIRQVGFKQSSSMPLVEIFVPPDVLIGIPDYETLERGYIEKRFAGRKKQYTAYNRDGQEGQTPQEEINWREIQAPFQREKFSSVLQKQHRLVILGDPGSGKSVLLQYLLLQLAQGQDAPVSASTPPPSTIPLYLPLAAYAEAYSLSSFGSHSLEDFLPVYLREMYLEDFALLLKYSLQQGKALLLLDGLDEISDATLRMKVVRQIELFTQTYAQNGFLVTSRIVGYREAPLAAGYTVYTLADFNEEQIKSFSQKWCLAYARWVRDLPESTTLQQLTTNEAEQLFEAAQSEPAIRKLAINPLLLTIFALFNHKETKFPSHRVELFELCATTLLDTWGKARGQSFTSHRNNPMRILRTLAFWMHEHRTVGVVPEEMLLAWVTDQLLVQGIARYKDQALQMAEEFLELVRGKTGILVERGRRRYGFLHQTFEEYFAARELALRKDRNEFIRTHLHEAHWREVILLAIGVVGIFEDEAAVTGILQDTILCAGSPFEKWLHRDLLFAGMCLADNVEVRAACEEDIIERIVYLYLTSPYYSLREACSEVLLAWRGTPTAMKASQLILNLLRKRGTGSSTLMRAPRPGSLTFEEKWAGYQKQLFHQYTQARLQLLRLGMISVLSHRQVEVAEQIASVLQLVTQPNVTVREAAAEVLGQIGKGQPVVVEALLGLLGDVDSDVRGFAVQALGQVGKGQQAVIEALLNLLSDRDSDLRSDVIIALGQVGEGHIPVSEALLDLLATTLSHSSRSPYHEVLLLMIIAEALGRTARGEPSVIEALLTLLSHPEVVVRYHAAQILGQVDSGRPVVLQALRQLLKDPDSLIRQAAAKALGRLGRGQPTVIQAVRKLLEDSDASVRRTAAEALGQLGKGGPTVIQAVRRLLRDPDTSVRCAAAQSLGPLADGELSAVNALLPLLADPVLLTCQ